LGARGHGGGRIHHRGAEDAKWGTGIKVGRKDGLCFESRDHRMGEESRRPRSHPESMGEEELCRIVGLKLAHPNWGPRKIRELYQRQHGRAASESSFKRVLERSGLTQKPNEVWTVDFKGSWYNGLERCEPLTVRDEYSRYLLELRALENAKPRRGFHHRGAEDTKRGTGMKVGSKDGLCFESRARRTVNGERRTANGERRTSTSTS
jgi:hypothetical protein